VNDYEQAAWNWWLPGRPVPGERERHRHRAINARRHVRDPGAIDARNRVRLINTKRDMLITQGIMRKRSGFEPYRSEPLASGRSI
jgi:hypothetical protein